MLESPVPLPIWPSGQTPVRVMLAFTMIHIAIYIILMEQFLYYITLAIDQPVGSCCVLKIAIHPVQHG